MVIKRIQRPPTEQSGTGTAKDSTRFQLGCGRVVRSSSKFASPSAPSQLEFHSPPNKKNRRFIYFEIVQSCRLQIRHDWASESHSAQRPSVSNRCCTDRRQLVAPSVANGGDALSAIPDGAMRRPDWYRRRRTSRLAR